MSKIEEFTPDGNLVHYKNSDGNEYWKEYDSNNNEIHYKNSYGYERWFDSNGNSIENPNKVVELSLEDIAKKFNVSLESLRIKD